MANNLNYGKLNEFGNIDYAPSAMHTDFGFSFNPREEDYLAEGWLKIAHNNAEIRDGFIYRHVGYEAHDGQIWAVYEYVAIEQEPRTFSKLKLYGAIAQLGAWDTVKSWLEGKTINGLNGWTAFQLAQDISEDHPMFSELADEARALLNIDDVSFDALLDGCRLEA